MPIFHSKRTVKMQLSMSPSVRCTTAYVNQNHITQRTMICEKFVLYILKQGKTNWPAGKCSPPFSFCKQNSIDTPVLFHTTYCCILDSDRIVHFQQALHIQRLVFKPKACPIWSLHQNTCQHLLCGDPVPEIGNLKRSRPQPASYY